MFAIIKKCLHSFCSDTCKSKLIGVSTDGATKMVCRLSNVVRRIENECH